MHREYFLFIAFLMVAPGMSAQEAPLEVSACELARNPGSFDKKLVRVHAGISIHFEDFSLAIPRCDKHNWIWLAFGGDVPGIVASTANDNIRKPGVDVTVEGVPYGMKQDESFRRLYALIAAGGQEHPRYHVTATMTGKFFAGTKSKHTDGTSGYSGYGHLGCCSLFLITEVSDVKSDPPANLRLRGTVADSNGKPLKGLTVIDDILGGSPPEQQQILTGANGEFEFVISGEQLRIEDSRYRPIALNVMPGGPSIRIRLEEGSLSDWHVPACAENDLAQRIGFSVLFRLPPTLDSRLEGVANGKSYFVFPRGKDPTSAELIISFSTDMVIDDAISQGQEQFQQRWIKDVASNIIGMDSRARRLGGNWREATFRQFETVTYSLGKGKPHKLFDQIVDSACMAK